MSTNYYRMRKPFTSAQTRPGGGHTGLSLWINHAKTGETEPCRNPALGSPAFV